VPTYEIIINGKSKKTEIARNGERSFKVKIDGKLHSVVLQDNQTESEKGLLITIDDKTYRIELPRIELEQVFPLNVEGTTLEAEIKAPRKHTLTVFEPSRSTPAAKPPAAKKTSKGVVTAPMTGKIISIKVKKDDQVTQGETLCVIEAMKMENEIAAANAGTVTEIHVSEGSSVREGEPLFTVT
jgi:biotin carboxyl carrier protein